MGTGFENQCYLCPRSEELPISPTIRSLPELRNDGNMRAFVPKLLSSRHHGGAPCETNKNSTTRLAFEVSSKRRRGFPSETHAKYGRRVVGGEKELCEKLGRNDPCPCGSGRRFQAMLHDVWPL